MDLLIGLDLRGHRKKQPEASARDIYWGRRLEGASEKEVTSRKFLNVLQGIGWW